MRALQSVRPSPEQLPILIDDGPGFRLIRGAAGSGKTTTALLRLRQLCRSRLARRVRLGRDAPVRILVLTFNRTLRGYIDQLASEQMLSNEGLDLTVETFGGWALDLVGRPDVIEDDLRRLARTLLERSGISASDLDYFADEIEYIIGRFPPDQRNSYLQASRAGRGRAPAVPMRLRMRLLEDVIRPYETDKARRGKMDWNDIALQVSKMPNKMYDVVIADETQDFSANQMRAILSHLDRDHVTTFIIDATQRVYPQGFSWQEIGINMRPQMVFSLTRNHRNTAEIARLASSLVRGLPPDVDGVLPDDNACFRSGMLPKVVVGNYAAQLDYMLDYVRPYLSDGDTVAILKPWGGRRFDFVRHTLRERNIAYCELTRTRTWPTGPEQVALSTVHSAKGLEFDHVLMPGLSSEVTPHGKEEGDGAFELIRRLIAMGIGRAKKTVLLGYKPGDESSVFNLIDPALYDRVDV